MTKNGDVGGRESEEIMGWAWTKRDRSTQKQRSVHVHPKLMPSRTASQLGLTVKSPTVKISTDF
jgi:hypothetical protein